MPLPGEEGGEQGILIESGVSLFTGKPFCTVSVSGKRIGQLDPDDVRQMALNWLATAEAAEQDAVVFQVLKETGLEPENIGGFIARMREIRVPDDH